MIKPAYDRGVLSALRRQPGTFHPLFGDLIEPDAVVMPGMPLTDEKFRERRPYYVHLSVTNRCNARCIGCVNSNVTYRQGGTSWLSPENDTRPERDSKAIMRLIESLDERDIVVSFYGGEPLLLPEKIESVISFLSQHVHDRHIRYMIYTNGQLLGEIVEKYPRLTSNMWLFSVSIDGTREQHNTIRVGTDLELIHSNLEKLRPVRRGHVLMWSTLREEQSLADCFREFIFLHEQGLVDNLFWHWVETSEAFNSLDQYLFHYERDLIQIIETYISWLAHNKLLPVAHLNELLLYVLTGQHRGTSACAVEMYRNFDISGGLIHSCADLPPDLAIGTIDDDGEPHIGNVDLASLITYKADLGCYECGVHPYCGGRCPVQAITSTAERLVGYCQMMRVHVGTFLRYMPPILERLSDSRLSLQDIYDQSAFYAQFTDVTP